MGEEPPVTGQGVWEEDLGSAGMLSALTDTAFHIRQKVKSLCNLQSSDILCILAGRGAACGEAGKASSPGTELVLLHLSQNPGQQSPKLGGNEGAGCE